jgi:glycosyltransferase involved in cell wall biosynthesis
MKKLVMLCLPGLQSFIDPIADALQGTYEVTKLFTNELDKIYAAVQDADIVWLEWANEMAIQATQNLIPPGKKVILRLHSYEALTPQFLQQIRWEVVTDVIFVSKYIKDYVIGIIPQQMKIVNQYVIPNGLKVEDFEIADYKVARQYGDNLTFGMLGHLNSKKGIMNLCQAFYALYEYYSKNSDHVSPKLKVGGTWQDPRYENYFFHFMEKTDLFLAVEVAPVSMGGASKFFHDVDVVLCTSPWESQNVSVMEGMACGCKPAVHWFPGAENHYQQQWLWLTYSDLTGKVAGLLEPDVYRDYIYNNYHFNDTLHEIKEVVGCR